MKKITYLFFLLLFFGNTAFAQAPEWVTNRPNSPLHYIGVSSASKNNTSFQKIAKRNALDDLLSEIRVTIQSVSILNQMDKDGTFREAFESTIKSTVADEIENLELVDTHEDEQNYWIGTTTANAFFCVIIYRVFELIKMYVCSFILAASFLSSFAASYFC